MEERLDKCEAEKRLNEERLNDENHKLRRELDEHRRTLGNRSSYAAAAAQSVRALVELVEEQKMELKAGGENLRTKVLCLQKTVDELQRDKNELECNVDHLRSTALEEATAKVKEDLDMLRLECGRLQSDRKSLEERLKVLQETKKRDSINNRSLSETVERLERQVYSKKCMQRTRTAL